MRLAAAPDDALHSFALSLSVGAPYRGLTLQRDRVARYFKRLLDHHALFPAVVAFRAVSAPEGAAGCTPFRWDDLSTLLQEVTGRPCRFSNSAGLASAVTARFTRDEASAAPPTSSVAAPCDDRQSRGY